MHGKVGQWLRSKVEITSLQEFFFDKVQTMCPLVHISNIWIGLKKNPHHGALWQAFAVMEAQLNNIDTAKSLFAESLKRCPTHAQTYQVSCMFGFQCRGISIFKGLGLFRT